MQIASDHPKKQILSFSTSRQEWQWSSRTQTGPGGWLTWLTSLAAPKTLKFRSFSRLYMWIITLQTGSTRPSWVTSFQGSEPLACIAFKQAPTTRNIEANHLVADIASSGKRPLNNRGDDVLGVTKASIQWQAVVIGRWQESWLLFWPGEVSSALSDWKWEPDQKLRIIS